MRALTRWSRAWMSETNDSSRSATNLTGRRSIIDERRGRHLVGIDVHLDAEASRRRPCRSPARCASGMPRCRAKMSCIMCGAWVRVVDGERCSPAVVVGEDRARLERHAGVAAEVEGVLDDRVGARRRRRRRSPAVELALEARGCRRARDGSPASPGRARVSMSTTGRQLLPVDRRPARAASSAGARVSRHHRRHRLALPAGALERERRAAAPTSCP